MENGKISMKDAVTQLSAIFPTIDLEVIELYITATNGNLNLTVVKLLEISDPTFETDPTQNYQSDNLPDAHNDFSYAHQLQEQYYRESVLKDNGIWNERNETDSQDVSRSESPSMVDKVLGWLKNTFTTDETDDLSVSGNKYLISDNDENDDVDRNLLDDDELDFNIEHNDDDDNEPNRDDIFEPIYHFKTE
eukprot:TRINITY_DN13733_c0_g1_i1.p1 TRINITY_DN13733_c0_g1~~TRINITY_DN13733_c0_g1_i1.p1  ORF type:complete len:203 (+),score=75.05 TRINITY_DN13733_c0_g1_i1:36-611(+)